MKRVISSVIHEGFMTKYRNLNTHNRAAGEQIDAILDKYSDNDMCYMLMKDDRYLATINNLAEPVVKTSSKTMKVTYTLTFEE